MERVTYKNEMGYHLKPECESVDTVSLLGPYEDTGLTPAQYVTFADGVRYVMENADLGHLIELVKAEKEGRLVVLPCKVGDTVYRIDPGNYHSDWKPFVHPIEVDEISWKCAHTMKGKKDLGFAIIANGSRYKLSNIGKTVFLTREEAERVLGGGQRHG